jgi:hypothetical protein
MLCTLSLLQLHDLGIGTTVERWSILERPFSNLCGHCSLLG